MSNYYFVLFICGSESDVTERKFWWLHPLAPPWAGTRCLHRRLHESSAGCAAIRVEPTRFQQHPAPPESISSQATAALRVWGSDASLCCANRNQRAWKGGLSSKSQSGTLVRSRHGGLNSETDILYSYDLTAEELALTPYAILNIFQWEYLPPKNNPNKFSCLQWGSHRKFYTSHEHFICLSELRMLMILPWYFFWYQMGIFWPHLSIH